MYTLGIETSCDETSCAIVKGRRILANVTLSSLKEHVKYGGVVPEIATRAHLTAIDKVFAAGLKRAGIPAKKIGLIAVTCKPGLAGALVVGLNFAKALALGLEKPLIGINHLQAHLFAPYLDNRCVYGFPFLGAVVSGGHTDFYLVRDFEDMKVVGRTSDDACGEVFDKVARELKLGYPGGPVIDRAFDLAAAGSFNFNCGRKGLNLSFSGIKTAVLYKRNELIHQGLLDRSAVISLVSAFQKTAIEAIIAASLDACAKYRLTRMVWGGGVTANSYLRLRLAALSADYDIKLSPLKYSGDNAAMVAGLGFYLYNKGYRSGLDLDIDTRG